MHLALLVARESKRSDKRKLILHHLHLNMFRGRVKCSGVRLSMSEMEEKHELNMVEIAIRTEHSLIVCMTE